MAGQNPDSKIKRSVTRIRKMEKLLDKVLNAVSKLENCEDTVTTAAELNACKQDAAALGKYLSSKSWKTDFELDEKGLLPKDLKRGVLSEDGIYNALSRYEELLDKLNTEEI